MKRKLKKSLSSTQKKGLLRISLLLLLLGFLWLLFAPKMGVVSLYKERSRLVELEKRRVHLEEENSQLRQEIDRIENDIDYFEQLAREKHGLLKKNEIVFDFSKEDEKDEKDEKEDKE